MTGQLTDEQYEQAQREMWARVGGTMAAIMETGGVEWSMELDHTGHGLFWTVRNHPEQRGGVSRAEFQGYYAAYLLLKQTGPDEAANYFLRRAGVAYAYWLMHTRSAPNAGEALTDGVEVLRALMDEEESAGRLLLGHDGNNSIPARAEEIAAELLKAWRPCLNVIAYDDDELF